MTRAHAERDEVKASAEADFFNLYMEHGGRRHGRALCCIFHDDQRPSASIHKGRFRCFGCDISLDVFAFIQKAQSTDFRGALSYLADRYGVPLNNRVLTDAERREYAESRRIRADAVYFADAAGIMAEWGLEESSPTDPARTMYTALLKALRLSPEAEYSAWLKREPAWAAALVYAGRERAKRLQVALARWIVAGMSGDAVRGTAQAEAMPASTPEAAHVS